MGGTADRPRGIKGARQTEADMKATLLLRQHITDLLAARREEQESLELRVGHSEAWINAFLRGKQDNITMRDLDKIAVFFGLATYQLFQPGISSLTERRVMNDRRSGRDRWIGHQQRALQQL